MCGTSSSCAWLLGRLVCLRGLRSLMSSLELSHTGWIDGVIYNVPVPVICLCQGHRQCGLLTQLWYYLLPLEMEQVRRCMAM